MTTTLSPDSVASGVVVSVVPPAAGPVTRKPPRERLEAVGVRPVDDFEEFLKGSMAEQALA